MIALHFTFPYLVQLGLGLELGAAPAALVRPRVRAAAAIALATSLLVAHLRGPSPVRSQSPTDDVTSMDSRGSARGHWMHRRGGRG